ATDAAVGVGLLGNTQRALGLLVAGRRRPLLAVQLEADGAGLRGGLLGGDDAIRRAVPPVHGCTSAKSAWQRAIRSSPVARNVGTACITSVVAAMFCCTPARHCASSAGGSHRRTTAAAPSSSYWAVYASRARMSAGPSSCATAQRSQTRSLRGASSA